MKNLYQVAQGASLGQVLESASEYLNDTAAVFGHGTDNAWDESVALLLWAMGYNSDPGRDALESKISLQQARKFEWAINRRSIERIPAAYITGEAWFCGLKFKVDERVLVPRSPIAELIQNDYQPWLLEQPKRILDLCCGSGCIGLAAAIHNQSAEVVLADLSNEALQVAKQNLDCFELQDRVSICEGDLFEATGNQLFDLILSNPPYVDAEDLASMPVEYSFEPEIGLGSGVDGLDISRRILREAKNYLTDCGVLVLEVGNSWVNLEKAFPAYPFTWIDFTRGGEGVLAVTRRELEEGGF